MSVNGQRNSVRVPTVNQGQSVAVRFLFILFFLTFILETLLPFVLVFLYLPGLTNVLISFHTCLLGATYSVYLHKTLAFISSGFFSFQSLRENASVRIRQRVRQTPPPCV